MPTVQTTVPNAKPKIKSKEDMEYSVLVLANKGDKENLEIILSSAEFKKQRCNINVVDFRTSRSALHYAAKNNHVAVIELLLEHKADLAAQDNEGETARSLAERLEVNEASVLLRKVEAKAFPPITEEEADEFFRTPDLKKFCQGLEKFNCNHYVLAMTTALLEEEDDSVRALKVEMLFHMFGFNINSRDKNYNDLTMLHTLLLNNGDVGEYDQTIFQIVKLTTELSGNRRLNPNIKASDGQTLLMRAIVLGYPKLVDFLLERRKCINLALNAQDNKGYTALHYASIFRKILIIRALIRTNELKVREHTTGRTPMQLLKEEHQDELSKAMEHLLLQGDRDEQARKNYLKTDDLCFIVTRKVKDDYLKLSALEQQYFISSWLELHKKYGILATKKNVTECLDKYLKFVICDVSLSEMKASFSDLKEEHLRELLTLEKQFAGISLREQILSKTKAAEQELAPATANSQIVTALTAVGLTKKPVAQTSEVAKELKTEEKTPT